MRMHMRCGLAALLAFVEVVGGARAADEPKVPLRTELPKPMIGSWPKPIPSGTPCEELMNKRPDFMIPVGCSNLALGKKVSASAKRPLRGELSEITDGLKSCEEEGCVELDVGPQWIQIDLGATRELFALLIWRQVSSPRFYYAVVIRVSDDPKFLKGVLTLYSNDRENIHGLGVGKDLSFVENYQGQLIDAKGVKGRYVRLYSSGNTWNKFNHYSEVEVWGRPAP